MNMSDNIKMAIGMAVALMIIIMAAVPMILDSADQVRTWNSEGGLYSLADGGSTKIEFLDGDVKIRGYTGTTDGYLFVMTDKFIVIRAPEGRITLNDFDILTTSTLNAGDTIEINRDAATITVAGVAKNYAIGFSMFPNDNGNYTFKNGLKTINPDAEIFAFFNLQSASNPYISLVKTDGTTTESITGIYTKSGTTGLVEQTGSVQMSYNTTATTDDTIAFTTVNATFTIGGEANNYDATTPNIFVPAKYYTIEEMDQATKAIIGIAPLILIAVVIIAGIREFRMN